MKLRNVGGHLEPGGVARGSVPPATSESVGRWTDRRTGGKDAEDRAADLFRRVPAPLGLDPAARARVKARLDPEMTREPGRAGRPRFRLPALRWGVAAGLLFGSGAVIAARGVDRWWRPAPPPVAAGAAEVAPARPTRHARRTRLPASGTSTVAGDVATGEDIAIVAPSSEDLAVVADRAHPTPAEAPLPAPRSSARARASGLSIETDVLNDAFTRLRQRRDPAGALRVLDEYRARFPAGVLAEEAGAARVDALLMLRREDEARRALETLTLEGGSRARELRVIRGELRAA
ncbi:MAG: hypothetical protein ABUS79_25445, partial [Pseudomonadota bacterium]